MASKSFTNTLADAPTETLSSGYGAAAGVVRRGCRGKPGLEAQLCDLLRDSGFQTTTGLIYYARLLLWYLAGSSSVPVAGGLHWQESRIIRERAVAVCVDALQGLPPYTAPVACERLGLDPYDHQPTHGVPTGIR